MEATKTILDRKPAWWHLVAVLPFAFVAGLLLRQALLDEQIAKREQTADAMITSHKPEDHNSYQYVFTVGGKGFYGWDIPPKHDFVVGDHTTIYYDPANPSRNSMGEFEQAAIGNEVSIAFCVLVVIAAVWFTWARKTGKISAKWPGD